MVRLLLIREHAPTHITPGHCAPPHCQLSSENVVALSTEPVKVPKPLTDIVLLGGLPLVLTEKSWLKSTPATTIMPSKVTEILLKASSSRLDGKSIQGSGVGLGIGSGSRVGVGSGPPVGVGSGEPVGVGSGEPVGVGSGEPVGVGSGVAPGGPDGVGFGPIVGVGPGGVVGVGCGVGSGLIVTCPSPVSSVLQPPMLPITMNKPKETITINLIIFYRP